VPRREQRLFWAGAACNDALESPLSVGDPSFQRSPSCSASGTDAAKAVAVAAGVVELVDDSSLEFAAAQPPFAETTQAAVAQPRRRTREVTLVRRPAEQAAWLEAVGNQDLALSIAPPEIRADREVVLAALRRFGAALQFAAPEFRACRECVLTAVRHRGGYLALDHAAPEFREDREVMREAVAWDGFALRYASEALRADRELVVLALESRPVLRHASEALRADRELVLTAVRLHGGDALRDAAPSLRADREIVLAAVQRNVEALDYAAEHLQADPVILAAIGGF